MSNKFLNPVNVPDLATVPPNPDLGFVRIYGRGGDPYALFDDGTEVPLTGGVAVGGEVTDEKVCYELPELNPVPVVSDAVITGTSDTSPTPQSEETTAFLIRDEHSNPIPVQTINITATVSPLELNPVPVGLNSLVISTDSDVVPEQTDTPFVRADYNMFANSVASSTTWANTTNALDNTTGTSATLEATASGLAGTTNESATGDMTVDFKDVNFGDLVITSSLILSVETAHTISGIPIIQPTTTVEFQYSLNGGSFVTFHTQTISTAKAVTTVDLTTAIGTSVSAIDSLQVKATGSVTSGTGVGVSSAVHFHRAWLTFTSEKEYTS